MENRMTEIASKKNKQIKIGIIPGHFATNHSHVNFYVDMDSVKRRLNMAKEAAKVISAEYITTPLDTIICLEGTQMLGALVAEQLADSGRSVNAGSDICVITPELNSNNQMIFRDNTQNMIWNKRILLLISSASTGKTVDNCLECLRYYNGKLVAVTAIFSAIDEIDGIKINSIFTADDLPEYMTHTASGCPMCAAGRKVDAIVNDHGYSRI